MRERGRRAPGQQPGEPGAAMNLIDDPDERIAVRPAAREPSRILGMLPILGRMLRSRRQSSASELLQRMGGR
jgi:hypothetical protein